MKIQLNDNSGEVDLIISTVAITPTDRVSLFRCTNCGTPIIQYQGSILKIYPYVEPTDEVLTVNKCHRCGAYYTFQTQPTSDSNKPIRVVLLAGIGFGTHYFLCSYCRRRLLQFTNDVIVDLDKLAKIELPYKMRCLTPLCPGNYNFVDLV